MSRPLTLAVVSTLLDVGLVVGSGDPTAVRAAAPAAAGQVAATTAGSPRTQQVVEAFRRAGLEVGTPRPMTPDEFVVPRLPDKGLEAPVPIEGTRFSLPSFRQEVGGSVLRYSSSADAENAVGYWAWKSKQADSTADMLRVYAKDDIVLLLAWDISDGEALAYERALGGPDIASLTPTTQEFSPSTTGKSPAASDDPGIAFGKPVVNTEHRVSNPVLNLLYLVGLRPQAPGGQVPVSMSVLATNTTDQVKSFTVKATLKAGLFTVETFEVEVSDLPPGQSRPVLLYSSQPIPHSRYDSARVEVVKVLRQSATTPGAEGAKKLRFGTPSITTTSGPAEATVEITNEDPAPQSYTVRLTFLRGDQVLGVAMCRGENLPSGKTITATLRLVEGTAAGYDRLLLDADEAFNKAGGFCIPYQDSVGQGGKGR